MYVGYAETICKTKHCTAAMVGRLESKISLCPIMEL
jgi:hypothetical protein